MTPTFDMASTTVALLISAPQRAAVALPSLVRCVARAVYDWKSYVTIQADSLSEAMEQQVADDGDESEWYNHNLLINTRTRSSSRAATSPCSSASRSLSSRSRSNSNVSGRRRSNSKANGSADEVDRRLVTFEANAPRDCVLLAPPPARRRRPA